ncbi:MAG: T9SS type A sorting domain-containing protein [Salibacteraceae bacterium]
MVVGILQEYKYASEVAMDILRVNDTTFWLLTNYYNGGGTQIRIREFHTNGTLNSTKTHGAQNDENFSYKLIKNQDDNLVLLANDLTNTAMPIVYELDAEGDEIANYTFSQGQACKAYGIAEIPSGGYLLAGETDNGGDRGGIVIELDDSFNQGFVFERDETDDEYFRDIVVDSTGSIAVGATENMGEGGFDGFLVHLDAYGDSIMTETLGREEDDELSVAISQPAGKGGGLLAAGISKGTSGNGYLIKATKYGQMPCPLNRILFIDDFVKNLVIGTTRTKFIDSTGGILGDTTAENSLIQFSLDNESKRLILYGVNWVFESSNNGATRGGENYQILLNKFLSKAKRKGLFCSFVSDNDPAVFEGARVHNVTNSIMSYNFDKAGKIAFFLLEHEFWNPRSTNAVSGPTAGDDPDKVHVDTLNVHFESLYEDHKSFLDTLNQQKFKDANILAVHDYIGYLFCNRKEPGFNNNYFYTNTAARKQKAAELEKKSDAIFLVNYQKYRSIHWGLSFLVPTPPDTYHVSLRYHRQSYFGKNTRNTYVFPLFSTEYHEDTTSGNWCGPHNKAINEDFLGQFFRDTSITYQSFNAVEDTFINQYNQVYFDSTMSTADSVVIAGFGWFKYSCFNNYSFTKTEVHPCLVLPTPSALILEEPNSIAEKEKINNIQVYPNPFGESLFIISNGQIEKVIIRSLNGQVVIEKEHLETDIQLSITGYPQGIYILEVVSNGIPKQFKIIKQ